MLCSDLDGSSHELAITTSSRTAILIFPTLTATCYKRLSESCPLKIMYINYSIYVLQSLDSVVVFVKNNIFSF